jgi:hypothetical protein
LGGNIQMDLTYATIPSLDGSMFRLNIKLERRYHVEDPSNPINKLKYKEYDFGSYAILSNYLGPIEEEYKEERVNEVWYMHFVMSPTS